MLIDVDSLELEFFQVQIYFEGEEKENLFSQKNNKTLGETLEDRRYKKFKDLCNEKYNDYMDVPLGKFLLMLKNKGNSYYKLFLNKYGDLSYSHFWIDDKKILNKKGIYIYKLEKDIKYVGRCLDNFNKRINFGYGTIHPKNCYLDGQATNCHMNSKITRNTYSVTLWICTLDNDMDIIDIENKLIEKYNPTWNISGKNSKQLREGEN